MISPPCVAMRAETFAVSMLVPPPTATNPSKSPSTAKSAAAWKESSVGSTRERSHTSTSMPSASINSTMRPVMFAFTTPGSEVSITRPTPICFSSQPASSEAPGPYFRGVASIVKMVSLFDLESLCMMSFLSPREVLDPCTRFFQQIHVLVAATCMPLTQGLAHFLYTVWHTSRSQDMPKSRCAWPFLTLEYLLQG